MKLLLTWPRASLGALVLLSGCAAVPIESARRATAVLLQPALGKSAESLTSTQLTTDTELNS